MELEKPLFVHVDINTMSDFKPLFDYVEKHFESLEGSAKNIKNMSWRDSSMA